MKLKSLILVLFCLSMAASGQKKVQISGKVIDTNQRPVAGARVYVDHVNTGKLTGKNGSFRVKASPDAKLIAIQTKGGQETELPVDGQKEINFSVPASFNAVREPEKKVEATAEQEDMINVGYSSVSQKGLTTPVTKIDGRKQKIIYKDIYEMLRGKPGVQVSGKSVTIQGISSINSGTEPLYVVDGVVVNSVDDISPQQVRSIEILKGPSASIYGSRGANGVILITMEGAQK